MGSTSATLVSMIDAGGPLFLHPSDCANLSIVTIKLKGTENYTVRANSMNLALQVKNKIGFIDVSCRRSTTDEVLGRQWDRCNSIVLTWILNSVSDELYLGHVYSKLASEVWRDLKETYDKFYGSIVFNLYQKINSSMQSGMHVSEYYHKLNCMWKQLDQLLALPSCTCDASKQFNDFNHLIKLMQFLMGLDSTYQYVRTNLLTKETLPTVKDAFSIISREESHLHMKIFSERIPNNTVSFAAKTNQGFDSKKKGIRPPNPNLKCSHRNKTGHTIEKCFELVGYPTWMTSKNNGNKGSRVSNNVITETSDTASLSSAMSSLTSEQVAQLLSLLNDKSKIDAQSSGFAGRSVDSMCFNSFVDMSCETSCDPKPVYCFSNFFKDGNRVGWIIDSGANQHMVMTDVGFINQIDVTEYNIKVKHPNGTSALVTKIGDVKLSDKVILYDVFLVPDYCVNLVSVHKLAKDCKLTVTFDENNCYIQDSQTKKIKVTGNQLNGLYFYGSSSVKVCNAKCDVNLWTPSSVLKGRSPYECVYGFEPVLGQLRVIGCLCFSTILNNSDKFKSHAEKSVLIGYSNEKKGYKLWSLDHRVMYISCDVRFYETIFPFKEKITLPDHDLTSNVNTLNFFDLYDSVSTPCPKVGPTPDDEIINNPISDHGSQQSNVESSETLGKADSRQPSVTD
ncbi:uncharacterized protein LOC110924952 [Helianthus annuus]|uniref:uncharacterized protein LOC110924952 n=1 Tax=Helianthus annuus TaxID=4232 RepID=UPI000B903945|nr:uncharacterized protein LOC110924952 [Helianthus annuus]